MAQLGPVATYKKVMNRLDSYTPLGYSLVRRGGRRGRTAPSEFKVGQRVACGGNQFALHAEYNWIPTNLCVAVPDDVASLHAAFTTVGAIAMQGFRQSDAKLGETACVIGLGLVGQILVQILRAAGLQVVGIDVAKERCELARASGACACGTPGDPSFDALKARLSALTGGAGADRIFLTAGGNTNQPVEVAAELARDRARDRRHRQVQARPALDRLLREGARRPVLPLLRARPLRPELRGARHRLSDRLRPLDRAPQHGMRARPAGRGTAQFRRDHQRRGAVRRRGRGRTRRSTAASCRASAWCSSYPLQGSAVEAVATAPPAPARRLRIRSSPTGRVRLGVIGCGNYATTMLLPHLKGRPDVELVEVATTTSLSAANAQAKFGFARVSTDYQSLLADPDINAVLIATRHDSHAFMVCEALRAGKAVFVEKPLAVTRGAAGRDPGCDRGDRQRPAHGRLQPPLRARS